MTIRFKGYGIRIRAIELKSGRLRIGVVGFGWFRIRARVRVRITIGLPGKGYTSIYPALYKEINVKKSILFPDYKKRE
jgi:hypothetical protein